jgi:hypothetical protein
MKMLGHGDIYQIRVQIFSIKKALYSFNVSLREIILELNIKILYLIKKELVRGTNSISDDYSFLFKGFILFVVTERFKLDKCHGAY